MVGVVASAGGVEALSTFVAGLPEDLPAAVLVVLHIRPSGPSMLPHILSRAGKLPARHPEDGEALAAGVILVAPPDRHLVVSDGHARVLASPPENRHRPSADALLRSVAEHCGPAAGGVVLSGTMDDGAAGLAAVRRMGAWPSSRTRPRPRSPICREPRSVKLIPSTSDQWRHCPPASAPGWTDGPERSRPIPLRRDTGRQARNAARYRGLRVSKRQTKLLRKVSRTGSTRYHDGEADADSA